jgi:hypothetical protein
MVIFQFAMLVITRGSIKPPPVVLSSRNLPGAVPNILLVDLFESQLQFLQLTLKRRPTLKRLTQGTSQMSESSWVRIIANFWLIMFI